MLDRSQSQTFDQNQVYLGIEGTRCDAVHEAINKFVVYEKFAEMTHKYDIQQFGKLLDEYNTPDELLAIRKFVGMESGLAVQGKEEDVKEAECNEEAVEGEEEKGNLSTDRPIAQESSVNANRQEMLQNNYNYRFHFVQYQPARRYPGLGRQTDIS